MPLFSNAMPFFPAPCPFYELTFYAPHFGKKFVKIGQKIRKLQDFLYEICSNKFGKIYDQSLPQLLIALILFLLSLKDRVSVLGGWGWGVGGGGWGVGVVKIQVKHR